MKIEDLAIAENIEIAIQKRQQSEYKLLGSFVPKIDGYTVFEFDSATRQFSPATYRVSENYVLGGSNNKKLDVKKGCVYVEALNEKNALKRLKRGDIIYSS